MNIWLDTINSKSIEKAKRKGLLYGTTTNPAIIAQSGRSIEQNVNELLELHDGLIAVQVVAQDSNEMIIQGLALYELSPRIVVKVPITEEGLDAIHALSQKEVPVMATIAFRPHHALTAALAGAKYIAPYVNHIEKQGDNPWEVLEAMMRILSRPQFNTEILAASIVSMEQLQRCAEIGLPHMTIKDPLLDQLIATTPAVKERIDYFASV